MYIPNNIRLRPTNLPPLKVRHVYVHSSTTVIQTTLLSKLNKKEEELLIDTAKQDIKLQHCTTFETFEMLQILINTILSK